MNTKIIRFLHYWRLPLFSFILFFVLMFIATSFKTTVGDISSVIWLFNIPLLLVLTGRAIFLRIRDAIAYHCTGVRNEDFNFPEVNFVQNILYEIGSVKELTNPMKLRYLLFRILGIILIIGGSIGCLCFYSSIIIITLFTLVIITGATLCIIANPASYNARLDNARMVPYSGNMTNESLYNLLRTIPTSLGRPHLATVRGFKKPVIVYGSKFDNSIYIVYKARFFAYFHVSSIYSFSLQEYLSEDESYNDDEIDFSQEFASCLDEITFTVEKALDGIVNN